MIQTVDLFLSKKDQIAEFIRQKTWARTSDVMKFGLSIYTTRGDRYARELAEEGRIKRMSDDMKDLRFGPTREDIWEWVG